MIILLSLCIRTMRLLLSLSPFEKQAKLIKQKGKIAYLPAAPGMPGRPGGPDTPGAPTKYSL